MNTTNNDTYTHFVNLRAAQLEIAAMREASALAWEGAIDGAASDGDKKKAAALKDMADDSDNAYGAALECLTINVSKRSIAAAKESLEEARSLEADGGDSSHAISALEALAKVSA